MWDLNFRTLGLVFWGVLVLFFGFWLLYFCLCRFSLFSRLPTNQSQPAEHVAPLPPQAKHWPAQLRHPTSFAAWTLMTWTNSFWPWNFEGEKGAWQNNKKDQVISKRLASSTIELPLPLGTRNFYELLPKTQTELIRTHCQKVSLCAGITANHCQDIGCPGLRHATLEWKGAGYKNLKM